MAARRAQVRRFRATIAIIGINPYVLVPDTHLRALFAAAGRDKGPIPIELSIGARAFKQNLVRYQGAWRLYLNQPMRDAAGKDVGDVIALGVRFDPEPRVEPMPKALARALKQDRVAREAFAALPPSRKKEIQRYLNALKTQASAERNAAIVVRHLRGEQPPTLGALLRKRG
jgi:hypothetical protein